MATNEIFQISDGLFSVRKVADAHGEIQSIRLTIQVKTDLRDIVATVNLYAKPNTRGNVSRCSQLDSFIRAITQVNEEAKRQQKGENP